MSSRVLFGSAGLGEVSQERADEVLPWLLEHGVNHLDTAASYGDAELRLAPWLAAHPGKFFIATKTGERTADGARASLERSLERLGVDHVDLVQLHDLVEPEDWEQAHGPGGALEALVRARDEGLVSFVGVTGHGLRIARMHLASLERFDYDSVLFPYNYLLLRDDRYRSDVEQLIATCVERRVAIQTIKAVARRRWPAPGSAEPPGTPGPRPVSSQPASPQPESRAIQPASPQPEPEPESERLSWYEPLYDEPAIARAVHYVLGRPGLFLASTSDFRILQVLLRAAETSGAVPADSQMAADVEDQSMSPLFDGGELERI